jgi:integrase/recombinase XerD
VSRSPWPKDSALWIEEFLAQAGSGSKSPSYRVELVEFSAFVSPHGGIGALDRKHLRQWLRSRQANICASRVILGARIVRRFLDWLIAKKVVAANPLASLSEQYDCRSIAAIVRAMLGPSPAKTLESLRPLPRYGSHLGSIMQEHVERMRSLGYRYNHESRFLHFDRFLQQRPGAADQELNVLIREYAEQAPSAHSQLSRLSLGRILAQALTRAGSPTAVTAADRMLIHEATRQRLRPFIYTAEQVELLLRTAANYPAPTARAPLRPITLYTMIVLAYCAGLRLGEIVRLRLGDIDFDQGAIDVRDTKFFKSRRLPLSKTAIDALHTFLKDRLKTDGPQTSVFIHGKGGYSYVAAGHLLRDVIRKAGLHKGQGRGPRFHDLRHTFVVHRMTQWYREGVNPQGKLIHLSTYLGHRNIHSTLVYLTITQELLQQANLRFRTSESGVLKVIKGEC